MGIDGGGPGSEDEVDGAFDHGLRGHAHGRQGLAVMRRCIVVAMIPPVLIVMRKSWERPIQGHAGRNVVDVPCPPGPADRQAQP